MTDIDKINQVFAVLKMARDIEGVGAIKSFSFSWDIAHMGVTQELMPRISVEYWAKPTV
jgi:hypothetical protein